MDSLILITFAFVLIFMTSWLIYSHLRLKKLEKRMLHLANISAYFPDFIEKGERITRSISDDLQWRQHVLKQLVQDAEIASSKLSDLEEKIKDNTLSGSKINEILILINQGFSAKEVATRMNIPSGEIDLILNLKTYLNKTHLEKLS